MPGNVTIGRTALPNTQFRGNIDELLQLFVDHLYGTLATGTLTGQLNGTAPTSDVGPWLNQTIWEVWNDDEARYLPAAVVAGRMYLGTLVTTEIKSGATVNRTLTTPDKDGTIATTADINTPNATQTLGGSSFFIDGAQRTTFYVVLSGTTSIGVANFVDNLKVDVYLEQPNNSSFTVTWTPAIIWIGGTPTMSTAASGHRSIDHYTIRKVGDLYFGEYVQTADIVTAGFDTSAPTFVSSSRFSDTVTLNYSEPLRGAAINVADFVVKHAGTNQTISSATANGSKVTIVTATTAGKNVATQVSYTGTDIKDLAGNAAANLALTTVPYGTTSSGGDPGGFGGSNGLPV